MNVSVSPTLLDMPAQVRCSSKVNAKRLPPHLLLASSLVMTGCLAGETVLAPGITPLVSPVDVMLDGRAITPLDVVPLADGSLLVEGNDPGTGGMASRVLLLVPTGDRTPEVIGAGGEIGSVRDVITNGDLTIVLGELGVFAIRHGALFRVPIESMLDVASIRAIAAIDAPGNTGLTEWLVSTDAGLTLIEGSSARPLLSGGAALHVDHLAARGPGAAWAADASGLLRITWTSTEHNPTTARIARTGSIEALASDSDGFPWWVEGGQLFSMTRDGRVIPRALPTPAGTVVQDITALPQAGEIWLQARAPMETTTRALFHFDGSVFRPIEGTFTSRTLRCASASECVALDGSGHIERWRIRHAAELEGLTEGASLHERTEVRIAPEASALVQSVEARVGEQVLTVTANALSLDPTALGIGPRTLTVTVRWSDGTLPLVLRRSFLSEAAATWVDDIEPVYRAQCADCHGAAGPSARRLDTRADWMREWDRVRPAIQGGAMPLGRPALPRETVALIQTWAEAGFPE